MQISTIPEIIFIKGLEDTIQIPELAQYSSQVQNLDPIDSPISWLVNKLIDISGQVND
jgi:hypothetical protein